jgi:hypothetical protein
MGQRTDPITVRVHHHVYSSAAGYRTLFTTLPDNPLRRTVEEWAAEQGGRRHDGTAWYSMPLTATIWVLAKAFRAGVDQAGRRRMCVHSLILQTADLPESNPARMPIDAFIRSKAKLDPGALESALGRDVVWPAPKSAGGREDAPERVRLCAAMLAAERGTVLAGRDEPTPAAAALLDQLPRPYRTKWVVATTESACRAYPCRLLLAGRRSEAGESADSSPVIGQIDPPKRFADPPADSASIWPRVLRDDAPGWSAGATRFRDWLDRMPFDSTPAARGEDWLVTAYACLGGLDDATSAAQALREDDAAQVALGVICLGWAGHTGAGIEFAAALADALRVAGRMGPLTALLDRLVHGTAADPVDGDFGDSPPAEGGVPPEVPALMVRVLLNGPARLGPATLAGLPNPTPTGIVASWSGEQRAALWAVVYEQCRLAVTEARGGGEPRDIARLATILTRIGKRGGELFSGSRRWVLDDAAKPGGVVEFVAGRLESIAARRKAAGATRSVGKAALALRRAWRSRGR